VRMLREGISVASLRTLEEVAVTEVAWLVRSLTLSASRSAPKSGATHDTSFDFLGARVRASGTAGGFFFIPIEVPGRVDPLSSAFNWVARGRPMQGDLRTLVSGSEPLDLGHLLRTFVPRYVLSAIVSTGLLF